MIPLSTILLQMLQEKIKRPTLLLDKNKCLNNIELMLNKAKENNIQLRPHFKTHQSHTIGRWFKNYGIHKITVSSVRMAEYFAADNWEDITIAFPHNLHESEQVAQLAQQILLNIVVENLESLQMLCPLLKSKIHIFIKVDTGYNRTGLSIEKKETIDHLLDYIDSNEHLVFEGFLIHAGHTYQSTSQQSIQKIHQESLQKIQSFRAIYSGRYPQLTISYGDTPSCSVVNNFDGIDEIRPGNFVFYDLSQWRISSCSLDQIAVAMACPVVAKHPDRNEAIIYGGGVHFSKDRSIHHTGQIYFGLVAKSTEKGWSTKAEGAYVKSLSQEHGIIQGSSEWLSTVHIGDILYILPIHSCMTADLMKEYLTTEGVWIRDMLRLT